MKLPSSFTTITTFSKYLALFILILFPLIGFLLGISYQKSVNQPVLRCPNSIPSQTPTQPISDETSNWKTYRNSAYGFEVKYNSESSPTELTGKETAGQNAYLFSVSFGTVPLKFPNGFELKVTKQLLGDVASELIGHTTDTISQDSTLINDVV